MNSNKVSVIIPSFNRYSYLLNAITSIQNQTHDNYEIIVVNDGSTEDGYAIYEIWHASGRHPQPPGPLPGPPK